MNLQLILPVLLIVVLVLFTVRNGRKRQKDQAAISEGLKPGAEIMTTFGVFGTIKSVDEAENKIVITTAPGSELTIHRQALGRVVTPTDASTTTSDLPAASGTAVLNGEPVEVDPAAPPAFGQRTVTDESDRPAARAAERPTD